MVSKILSSSEAEAKMYSDVAGKLVCELESRGRKHCFCSRAETASLRRSDQLLPFKVS